MSFCSARNIDFNILFTLVEQANRNLYGFYSLIHVLYFYQKTSCVCVCVHMQTTEIEPLKVKKKKNHRFP